MYNRTHYNRQSYNRKSRSEFEWTGTATAESRASGSLLIERRLAGNVAEAVAEAYASGAGVATYGQEVMTILGVNMVPGDELVIDTEHMTVTLNGENIIDRVSDDAVFFKLMSGINDITVEGGTTADVRIVWKDRWL